jgi:hypothetical protein
MINFQQHFYYEENDFGCPVFIQILLFIFLPSATSSNPFT